jgi:hypothetical protein
MTITTATDIFLRRDAAFIFRINGRIKDAIKAQAKREGLTLTAKIEKLILDDLRREGVALELTERII